MKRTSVYLRGRSAEEAGLSFIEVIVAMGIIATLALIVGPFLANSLKYTSETSTSTAAMVRIQETIEKARMAPTTCSSLNAAQTTTSYNDGRSNLFSVRLTLLEPCDASATAKPQSINLEVSATRIRGNVPLAKVRTNVLVVNTP